MAFIFIAHIIQRLKISSLTSVNIKYNYKRYKVIKQITFLVGLNDKDTKVQEVNTLDAYKVVANIMATPCTIRECRGVYEHEDGTIVFETSLEVLVLDFDGTLNDKWVQDKVVAVKTTLNQESVVVQYAEVNSELR